MFSTVGILGSFLSFKTGFYNGIPNPLTGPSFGIGARPVDPPRPGIGFRPDPPIGTNFYLEGVLLTYSTYAASSFLSLSPSLHMSPFSGFETVIVLR